MRKVNNLNRVEADFKETWTTRETVLSEIGMTYSQYLNSAHWKSVKEKTLKRKRYKRCFKCLTNKNIDLHHKHYRFLKHVHELHSIVSLCRSCHNEVHQLAKDKDISVREATNCFLSGISDNAKKVIDDKTGIEYYSAKNYCNETGLGYKRCLEILNGKANSKKYKIRYID